jgi:methionyl aminopeptidase
MSIKTKTELSSMQRVSAIVASTLREMREYVRPGMSTKELDEFGGRLLAWSGARSAPKITYGFPGYTCISVNHEIAHGIPSRNKVIAEGDLVNIDVSAEWNGFWSDNGASFVVGTDVHGHGRLVDASREILESALKAVQPGMYIRDLGRMIELHARAQGFKVIKNLTGHGIGRKLHEDPEEIPNYYDRFNTGRFKQNSVIAIETFIATQSSMAKTLNDGWTLVGNNGGYVAQHEHTVVVRDNRALVLTDLSAAP